MYGIAALGAHGLLLLSVPRTPNAPVETVLAASTTVTWETESWELQVPTSAPEPEAAVAAPETVIAAPPAAPGKIAAAKSRRSESRAPKSQALAASVHASAQPREIADGVPLSSDEQGAAEPALNATAQGATSASEGQDASSGEGREPLLAANGAGAQGQEKGASALLRGPRLLASHDPCAGFFPGTAEASRGQVQLSVDVDAQGHPHPTHTLLELPRGQGFESAAKACAAHLHFAPALDAQGHPVSARARIALKFERS
jgi:outer membrane biosynthesis protein TonB